ncbi:GGDEF domain-containing protein [Sporomusa termitida]|uniref:GGDEF: diguanylate cyclase (GGDEF) domain protein n=1 Tax=Sporomusa termitida TaxID=2377 RepID=A0A517DQS4_9FIRM|nr:GGDEF domain-containing protein [Sporomusa termitida]QDR79714.1 GGDEF: diguanylate cyclase (GGDEF) domain protein [Sporomusa termitida]
MPKDKKIGKPLATRMFVLALITGLLISLCTPLTYLGWAWKAKQAETAALAEQIAREAQAIISNTPYEQQYNLQQLNKLTSEYRQQPNIKHLTITINRLAGETSAPAATPSIVDVTKRVDITVHGTACGYVELTSPATPVIMSTILLAGIFVGLGLLTNTLLYRLPVGIISETEKDLDLMTAKLKNKAAELAHVQNILEQAALIDCKTGLCNTSQSIKLLDEEMARVAAQGGSLSVLMLDIDHFRHYNDHSGYIRGDEVLVTISTLLKTYIRTNDLAGRFGGEEFIILLPAVNKQQAMAAADRLRASIEKLPFPDEEHQPGHKITVSIGISTYTGEPISVQQLIAQVEQALQYAKNAGRNTVSIFPTTAATISRSNPAPL